MKYIFPVIIGTMTLFACHAEFRGDNEKHAEVIQEELSIFIDTVKEITLCQAWIPGKEGEPVIYFVNGVEPEDSYIIGNRSQIIAGEKALEIYCLNELAVPMIDDTIHIPYRLIDYIEYVTCKYNSYLGQDMTLYLSGPTGQHMVH